MRVAPSANDDFQTIVVARVCLLGRVRQKGDVSAVQALGLKVKLKVIGIQRVVGKALIEGVIGHRLERHILLRGRDSADHGQIGRRGVPLANAAERAAAEANAANACDHGKEERTERNGGNQETHV